MTTVEPFDEDSIPTRKSLLGRLKDWEDQESWHVFFDTYWKLIYRFVPQLLAALGHHCQEVRHGPDLLGRQVGHDFP